MTTIVPTHEEDPFLAVVRFTGEQSFADAGPEVAEGPVSRLYEEAKECIFNERWLDLACLMVTSADVIFSKATERDLECIYTIICNLVNKPESVDQKHEIAELIATKVSQLPNEKPALRLKILLNLYNMLETPYSQFQVYMKALNLALSGKVTEHILPSFKKLDDFLKEWNLGVKDQRDLFLAVANILKDNKGSTKESFDYLVKYLSTFSGESESTLAEAKQVASRAAIEFIKSPDMFQADLLDMPAVSQLEKDATHALVHQLLKIFLTQKLESYIGFQSANGSFLTENGLVHEDCVAKMRLISLVDLGSNESGRVPYSLIKETLQIEDGDVELWVVKAITAKLIDCRIDQLNQVVIVSRSIDRAFGTAQWQGLRSKLATWKGNITNIISTIQANKITEDSSQVLQGLTIR